MSIDMRLARKIPSAQYGFYLPIYAPEDFKTVRKIVLREFRGLVQHLKHIEGWDLLRVKDFQVIQTPFGPLGCECESPATYAWKCTIRLCKTFKSEL